MFARRSLRHGGERRVPRLVEIARNHPTAVRRIACAAIAIATAAAAAVQVVPWAVSNLGDFGIDMGYLGIGAACGLFLGGMGGCLAVMAADPHDDEVFLKRVAGVCWVIAGAAAIAAVAVAFTPAAPAVLAIAVGSAGMVGVGLGSRGLAALS